MTSKLLDGLSGEQLKTAESVGVRRIYNEGERICKEGDPSETMYMIETGRVAITKTTVPGSEIVLEQMGAGEFFGEMGLIDKQPRVASAIAKDKTCMQILKLSDLGLLLSINPQVSLNLIRCISRRLRYTDNRLVHQIIRQEKMSLVGQMAGSIIQDFKGPMTVIRLAAESIASKTESTEVEGHCSKITRTVDRMSKMATDMLDFSHGATNLQRQSIEPESWLSSIYEVLNPVLSEKDIKLKLDIQTKEKMSIDPERMARAVYNLAQNGIEAMPNGGVLEIRLRRLENEFMVEVADSGPGIPPDIRERLFEAFVASGKRRGTGLGTSIAKKIVEEHGGKISFTSNTERGTTFYIMLPIAAKINYVAGLN